MKPRALLTAREVEELRGQVARRLDRIALETQPEIAAAVLDLSGDRGAGLARFAGVIRADPALVARVLQQANTSYYRRGEAVTDVDRACVVLGADRLRAVAMGFTLGIDEARAAERRVARRVWRESIMRACVAESLCRRVYERSAPAAFVVGLVLDAGRAVLGRLLGPAALDIASTPMPPHLSFSAEQRSLPFTHVDVVAVLCARWNLPPTLAGAIEHHHAPVHQPPFGAARDEAGVLRAVAHVAGMLDLEEKSCTPRPGDWLPRTAERALGMSGRELSECLREGERAFARVRHDLQGVSAAATDLPALIARIQQQVDRAADQIVADVLRRDEAESPKALRLGGRVVEIEHRADGRWAAILLDTVGQRIALHEIEPGDSVGRIMESLALAPAQGDQIEAFGRLLRVVA